MMSKILKENLRNGKDGTKWGMGMNHRDQVRPITDTVSISMVDSVTGEILIATPTKGSTSG